MTLSVHGLTVSRGIAIGRAVIVASSRVDVAHYFVKPEQLESEVLRLREARNAVVAEISKVQLSLSELANNDAHPELSALLDVHLMLLQDEQLTSGVKHWIVDRHYNAEWALTTQLEIIARQFDEMEDPYLRERKADLEQVVERMLRFMRGVSSPVTKPPLALSGGEGDDALTAETEDVPLVLIAHDLSPADMLQFKQSVFAGFVTDVGGKTSHTAIVARSMDIPAVVGARSASQVIRQDDWVIIDGDAGVVVIDPSAIVLAEYEQKRRQGEVERERLSRLKSTPAITLDGQRIELMANIEQPGDAVAALKAGAVGVGLFRTEFLFMGRNGKLPDEDEQYAAYLAAAEGMHGLPVTIRTVDVGADKPLDRAAGGRSGEDHLNPALGLRAIRWSLSEPTMFLMQLRAILRAAAHGAINLLVPMLAHASEIRQTLALVDRARAQLDERGQVYGAVRLGAMIEIPAAALSIPLFLRHFDFLSIGTNDLIQYTLAVDRADETVAHLYDPLHPAVLHLLSNTISLCRNQGKSVSVCGEMAGDVTMTRLLLGLGLRTFSMHPSQILAVKQQIVRSDTAKLAVWAQSVLAADDPAALMAD
ncbi:phosphoenolpyruvate--protein phosphotransferase [Hydrogenophaga crassostreae]|uniref:Phosphoenolpyruvate-protein phosphotransferase n=1 Tax=Hydrogenophaga crassostreae TaxID=1763535 RepID=A0A167I881_9BURK|nr:phosphoenolpyruvate--protein phosphotransferase [Hydrogenophaga crassostreae]AOW11822.1 phosphoenolpyruvate--protein phosphotransferase [Hydrogenophaga crassostreae]OAD42330.1 phosphoenolpyruvate--protein phosphotransferase [Hydrogenophaga crassostreae]